MECFLDIPQAEVFKKVAYTNLVKCTSPGEQDRLDRKSVHECLNRHFLREIALFKRAGVIIAFGREVEGALNEPTIRAQHGRPVVYVKHPSYHYRREEEETILAGKKAEILAHLRERM